MNEQSTATARAGTSSDASLGDLVRQLSDQSSRLVRDEMRLMQAELRQSVRHAALGAGLGGAAGLLALLGSLAILAGAIAALALALPVWAAALIVGVVLFAAAGVAAMLGKKQVDEVTPAVPQTVETVKEDIDELRNARRAG